MSDLGMKKRTARLEVPGNGVGPDTFVPFGVVHGDASGPRVAVVAGVHGTELVTQDAVLALWRELSAEQVRGSVTVVFVADVLAAQAGIPGANPVDGRNLNRVWPGSSAGTFSERLAARIWKELLIQAEVVIDVHGGEWTEEVHPFAIVHSSGDAVRDRRTVELASQMGLPYLQTTPGEGTLSGAVSRSGSIGLAMEVGGGGRRPAAEVALVVNALRGVLAAAGSIEAPAEAAGEPSLTLSGGAQLRSSVAGVVVQSVEVGQMVESGQVLCTVTDFDGEVLETVNSPHSGRVLLRALARVVTEGALLATVGWVDD